jgi:hypothetical protein
LIQVQKRTKTLKGLGKMTAEITICTTYYYDLKIILMSDFRAPYPVDNVFIALPAPVSTQKRGRAMKSYRKFMTILHSDKELTVLFNGMIISGMAFVSAAVMTGIFVW